MTRQEWNATNNPMICDMEGAFALDMTMQKLTLFARAETYAWMHALETSRPESRSHCHTCSVHVLLGALN